MRGFLACHHHSTALNTHTEDEERHHLIVLEPAARRYDDHVLGRKYLDALPTTPLRGVLAGIFVGDPRSVHPDPGLLMQHRFLEHVGNFASLAHQTERIPYEHNLRMGRAAIWPACAASTNSADRNS